MKLAETVLDLVRELDRMHPDGNIKFNREDFEGFLPNFIRTDSGYERHFSALALSKLHDISGALFKEDPKLAGRIELENYAKLVRSAIANLHADSALTSATPDPQNTQIIRDRVLQELGKLATTFTHYFPIVSMGLERDQTYVIGPVTLMTREHWLDRVDFSDIAKDTYLNKKDENYRWKELAREALAEKKDSLEVPGLAGTLLPAIEEHGSFASVTLQGYERELSRKVAEVICKSALDSISLAFGGRDHFFKQAMGNDRMPPIGTDTLIESNGNLWLPGSSIGPRRRGDVGRSITYEKDNREIFTIFGGILQGLATPTAVSHPNLCNRWATALEWLAEGSRDRNDAMALAKMATCLDILACGGKFKGILDMLSHLLEVPPDHPITKGSNPRKLSEVVKMIYDSGRSQILHGTHFKRLLNFQEEKSYVSTLARMALIFCAQRLSVYTGPDEDKVFRTIPPVPKA